MTYIYYVQEEALSNKNKTLESWYSPAIIWPCEQQDTIFPQNIVLKILKDFP